MLYVASGLQADVFGACCALRLAMTRKVEEQMPSECMTAVQHASGGWRGSMSVHSPNAIIYVVNKNDLETSQLVKTVP